MKAMPVDDDLYDKLDDLDLAEVALLLEQASPHQADAYDVLRGVLVKLAGQARHRRTIH